MKVLADLVGGAHTHLVLADLEAGASYVNLLFRGDPDGAEEYLRDYAAIDFRAPRVLASRPGLVRDERSYVSTQEARDSVIHNDFLPRFGIHNIAGASMKVDDCFGWFGISTLRRDTPFSEQQIAILGTVAPHIHRALRIAKAQHDLKDRCRQEQAVRDIVNIGLVTIRDGEVISANSAARAIFENRFLIVREGKLLCADAAARAPIARLMSGTGSSAVSVYDVEQDCRYLLRRHPTLRPDTAASRGFLLSIDISSASQSIALEQVVEFSAGAGVTTAEARALCASLSDIALADFAGDRGITLDTARKQMKSALSKLGLKSQKQLHRAFERYHTVNAYSPNGE